MIDTVDEEYRTEPIRRISWAAVFAGVAVALATQLLLSLLGIGIGASTIHPTSPDGASAQSVGTGSALWFAIASIISLFTGGWVAGRLAGIPHRADGVLHGIITWSLVTLVTIYLLTTTLASVISGATGAVGTLFNAAGAGIAAVAPGAEKAAEHAAAENGITLDTLTAKYQHLLNETGNPRLNSTSLKVHEKHDAMLALNNAEQNTLSPQETKQHNNELLYRYLHDTETDSLASDRRALINVVAAEKYITKKQAAKIVDEWLAEAKKTKKQTDAVISRTQQQVKAAGDTTAAAVSKAALSGFLLFLLGAVAAAGGGLLSIRGIAKDDLLVSTRTRRIIG